MRTYSGKNAKYNYDVNLCLEDILNLKDCLERTKKYWEPYKDFYPFTIRYIIEEWEKKIGKSFNDCNNERENEEEIKMCQICKGKIDNFSGNPNNWDICLPYTNGEGKRKTYHMGCVLEAVEKVTK